MRACRILVGALLAVVAGMPASAVAQADTAVPTLAVLDFVVDRNGGLVLPREFGASASDLLVNQLVESGRYRVLDRIWLAGRPDATDERDPALAEIRAAALAQGVDYLVRGSISRYSTENRNRTYGVGGFRLPLLGGVRRNRTDSVVGLVVRVTDVRTGEVVATATPLGTASRKKLSIGALGLFGGGAGSGGSVSTSGSRDALVSEALQRAVVDAGRALVNAAPRLARQSADLTAARTVSDRNPEP